MIINNRPLTDIYPNNLEACLILNHHLVASDDLVSDHNTSITYEYIDLSAYSNSVNETIVHF